MRTLHLSFWLHHPYELHTLAKWAEKGYYGGEVAFREADQAEYQPLLALLERNSQRYPKMRVSLAISGVWLEQAERWDAELIKRVRRLVEKGVVSLVTVPYYYSMAAFYDLDELKSQAVQMQEKLTQAFGVKSETLAVPELCYHNRLAKWAEKLDFRAMLAGDATTALDWRSPNRIYAAKGCEGLKVLFENAKLTQMIAGASELVTVLGAPTDISENVGNSEEKPSLASGRRVFVTKMFQKQLDFAFLRGEVVNLYFDSGIFHQRRDAGVIGLFDELIKKFMETPGMKLASVDDLLKIAPSSEVSVKKTVSREGEAAEDYKLPAWWTVAEDKNSQNLYSLRKNIVAVHDRDLYVDFGRLTAQSYAKGGKEFAEILADLQKRLLKLIQDDEAEESSPQSGVMASTTVRIKFDHKAREARKRREALVQMYREANAESEDGTVWDDDLDDAEAAVQVLAQRMKQLQEGEPDNYDDAAEAEVVAEDIWMETTAEMEEDLADVPLEDDMESDEKPKSKKKRKKIVIE